MRLRRLNLNRYGMFEDFSLDFGPSTPLASDFHIVFGPNEAGKTTMFNGLLDCFFGIPARTPYAFRHGSAVSVGATLEVEGEERGFVRTKKRNDSLLDEAGNPVDEELLSAALGRLSREAWTKMFSLDEITLAEGAEDILAAKGELGPVIFQSAAGLHDLTKTLESIQRSSEELFVPATRGRQRKTEIRELADKVGNIDAELKEIDTNERVYKILRDNLEAAQRFESEARSKHERLNARLNQLEKLKIAVTDVEELYSKRRHARDLEGYPEAPPGSIEEAEELLSRYESAKDRKRVTEERSERLRRESGNIAIDPVILRFREQVGKLTQSAPVSLRMRKDLLRRRDTRNELQEKLRFSLVCMGKQRDHNPRQYVLDDTAIANLGALTERFSNLQVRLANAKAELQKTDRAAREYDENPENTASVNLAAEDLESVVIEIRAADMTTAQKTASAHLENARGNVAGAAAALKPWNRNSIEILAQNPPTDDQAERWRDAAKRLDQEVLSIGEQRKRNDREIKQIQTRIDNLTQLEGLITDEHANSLRSARNQAWQMHYMRLDRETADAFKAAMDEDDRVRELRSEQSDRIGELRSIQMQLKEKIAAGDSLSCDEFRCDEERKILDSETAPVFASLGLPADFSPLDLPEWLKKRSQAEKSIIEFQKQERELIWINSELDSQRTELSAALAKAGVSEIDKGAALKKLLAIAADAANKAKNARDRLEQREKQRLAAKENLEERKSALGDIELELVRWNLRWKDACKDSWLRGMESQNVKALLHELRNLRENLSKLEEIDHRIAGMEREVENFVRQVRSLADELGMSSDADPFDVFDEIKERVEDARNAQREFEQNRKDQDRELGEIRRTTDELSTIERRVSEIAGVFSDEEPIVSAKDLLLALRKCDKRSALMAEIGRCERRLVNLLETETANEAVTLVESKKESLESEILACKAEVGAAGEEFERRVRDSAEAQNRIEAIGSDEKAAALAQDRQTLLVEIGETAKKALRSRLGVFAARRALQKYRESHRNELLEYATKFFSEMTLGNYSRLDADGSAAEDILIAKRESDNRSCQVHELSKGAQFQLYLALRLAGFRRFCQGNSPLPFVADDIMASFDDERAENAFHIMLDIATSSQMIYLTHHEHMVEIAVRAGGSRVRQHRLPVSSRSE